METKYLSLKRGRPTKYTKETPRHVMHYTKKCLENSDFPTIEHLASELGIGTRTIYAWENEQSEFQQKVGSPLRCVQTPKIYLEASFTLFLYSKQLIVTPAGFPSI